MGHLRDRDPADAPPPKPDLLAVTASLQGSPVIPFQPLHPFGAGFCHAA